MADLNLTIEGSPNLVPGTAGAGRNDRRWSVARAGWRRVLTGAGGAGERDKPWEAMRLVLPSVWVKPGYQRR